MLSKAKVLPAKYFGDVVDLATMKGSGKIIKTDGTYDASKGTLRVLEECDITVSTTTTHCYPGDQVPAGATVESGGEVVIPSYVENDKVVAKVMMEDSVKMLSAFSVSTSFFNAKNLSENTYLTWGRSEPAYLLDRPFITVKSA